MTRGSHQRGDGKLRAKDKWLICCGVYFFSNEHVSDRGLSWLVNITIYFSDLSRIYCLSDENDCMSGEGGLSSSNHRLRSLYRVFSRHRVDSRVVSHLVVPPWCHKSDLLSLRPILIAIGRAFYSPLANWECLRHILISHLSCAHQLTMIQRWVGSLSSSQPQYSETTKILGNCWDARP